MKLENKGLHDILKKKPMTKNRYLKDKSCATDLADDAILVNEVADTALNDRVPGCPSLAISEFKSEAVEVIIPEGQV